MGIAEDYGKRILDGGSISFKEALQLNSFGELEELYRVANNIRKKFNSNKVDTCTIMNAKSGRCSENCKFCAQSGHYNTGISEYPLVELEEALSRAKENESYGVHRFSLVTSGGALDQKDFKKIVSIYQILKKETKLSLCASLGTISYEQALILKDIGVATYHHNVETSSDYYANICTTHSYQDRINTIKNVEKAGLKVCSGGIIGMGESMEQRIKMAFEIRELSAVSVPINILNPIMGTPLYETAKKLEADEVLKTFAIFKFILPHASIRYAAGRASLGEIQKEGFKAGVSGIMVGNFLTTQGNKILDDLEMIKELGFEV